MGLEGVECKRHTTTSLDVEVALVEDVVVVARNDAGHSISASCWRVPVDFVLFVLVHAFHLLSLLVSILLIQRALIGECEAGKVRLHRW
jgi:hypothetical protein